MEQAVEPAQEGSGVSLGDPHALPFVGVLGLLVFSEPTLSRPHLAAVWLRIHGAGVIDDSCQPVVPSVASVHDGLVGSNCGK